MATVTGLGGNAALPSGFNAKLSTWSANYNVTTAEDTGFSDGGFRSRNATATDMTGSAGGVCEFDAANTAPLPAALADGSAMALGDLDNLKNTITLTATTGCTYAFTGVISGAQMTRNFDGNLEIVFNFESSGPITQTWDQTP